TTFAAVTNTNLVLIVVDNNGCLDTAHVALTVNPLPVAGFNSVPTSCTGSQINFNDQSAVSSGSIVFWNWEFGNNTTSSFTNPVMSYPDSGTYVVSLIITSDVGCSDTTTRTVNIGPNPVASFNASDVCLHNTVSFHNTSQISSGEPLAYKWKFGDNSSTSNLTDPDHDYVDYGIYRTSL